MNFFDEKNWESTEYGYFYKKDGIKFIHISNQKAFDDVIKTILAVNDGRVGLMIEDISVRNLNLLKQKKISYIINNKELKVFNDVDKHVDKNKITPTLVASPTGLEIIDILMWVDQPELEDSLSGFSAKYNLSRPKLTHLIQAFGVNNLKALKEELLVHDADWWLDLFDSPLTRRKMTPFITKETKKYSLKKDISSADFEKKINQLKLNNVEVELGGISFLKMTNDIRSSEFDLLVAKDSVFEVVRYFNARPAKQGEESIKLVITPLIGHIDDERLSSNHELALKYRGYNILRMLWGMNYSESRVKEQRKNLLEDYLASARSRNEK